MSVVSHEMLVTDWPSLVTAASKLGGRLVKSFLLRAMTHTLPPLFTNSIAAALPIPFDPPDMMAVFPEKGIFPFGMPGPPPDVFNPFCVAVA